MKTRHLRGVTAVASATLLMLAGNAAEAKQIVPPPFLFKSAGAITLTSPAANVVVTQNDVATGCTLNPTRGYGFMIAFDWTDTQPLKNGRTYTLTLQHAGGLPIEVDGLTTTNYVYIDCNAFVIDSNLSGWQWQVSRVRPNGSVGRTSEKRPFSFAPCRLTSGEACNAPAP